MGELVVAGIDVGGARKGFHAVALRGRDYLDHCASTDARSIADWCRERGARLIGIDAPCLWSATGRARPAEIELMGAKISCFSTPSLSAAEAHPKNHYGWMLAGAELFRQLSATHPLYLGQPLEAGQPLCFETFPQAVACALAGEIISAKAKRTVRRALLERAGLSTAPLKSIDSIDAALCALTAVYFAEGTVKLYGEATGGYIVVPGAAANFPAPRT